MASAWLAAQIQNLAPDLCTNLSIRGYRLPAQNFPSQLSFYINYSVTMSQGRVALTQKDRNKTSEEMPFFDRERAKAGAGRSTDKVAQVTSSYIGTGTGWVSARLWTRTGLEALSKLWTIVAKESQRVMMDSKRTERNNRRTSKSWSGGVMKESTT
ncbi:hypothetical protein Q8A73_001565 [Channa argus]|nr:hypothetical protein Q8A73_001565 [Channa argus]